METIKRMNHCLMASIAIFLFSFASYGQDYEKIQAAFADSYSKEFSGETNKAIEILKTVYDENSYEINVRLGWLSYNSGNFTESTAYYQKAINLKPFAIEPRFGLVMPAAAVGNWETVKQQYEKILEIDPMNTRANYYLGMIYYNREKYDDALPCFEKVANLYPFDYDGNLMYAWTNLKLGKLREAKVLFNKVLMMRPGDKSAEEGLKSIK